MRITTLLVALAATLTLAAPASAEPRVGGKYKVTGTNFDGSPYSGTAEITASSNSTCRIVWNTGGSTSTGFCMRDDSSLAAAYQMGKSIGLVIYTIQPDGKLNGVWTIADKSGAGTELLVPK